MNDTKTTFALYFGTRNGFPGDLVSHARTEMSQVLQEAGHDVLMLDENVTTYGAVETREEGEKYAAFLHRNHGRFGGVIICLPNFGDENGAASALRDTSVPILVQAYPDDMDRMAPALRRDAFCGKLSIMDVFYQEGIPFTALKPHVVDPTGNRFRENVDHFDRLCRVVSGLRDMTVGAIGARVTAFKTVRVDEVTLQRNRITMESLDLSDIFYRMKKLRSNSSAYKAKAAVLNNYADFSSTPAGAFDNLVRLGAVMDTVVQEFSMDAVALRCWVELQQQLGISPCILLGEMNSRGVTASCEVDIGNAVAMHALSLASGQPPACLDWNNNYQEDDDKCILFHCGPVPAQLMTGPGRVTPHSIISTSLGKTCGYGCHQGRITPFDFTFASMLTDAGRLKFYLGEGQFTEDHIPEEFFGCAGVAKIENLQDVLLHVGLGGFRHHVSLTPGRFLAPVREALQRYLGFDVAIPQKK